MISDEFIPAMAVSMMIAIAAAQAGWHCASFIKRSKRK
jgi:hypothetical protein